MRETAHEEDTGGDDHESGNNEIKLPLAWRAIVVEHAVDLLAQSERFGPERAPGHQGIFPV